MKRTGRTLSVAGSALGVLALGFVVSMAAHSVPGRGAEEPLLDVTWHPGIAGTTVLTWLILVAAVMGAIIMALSAREPRPPRAHQRRGIVVLVLGLVVFALVARYMGSISDSLLPETSEVLELVGEEPVARSNGSGAWLLSLLVGAVIAAAIIKVGLGLRSGATPFRDSEGGGDDPTPIAVSPALSPRIRGVDPRGRILDAYWDFEQSVAGAGVPREPSETAARHARRARAALGLGTEDLRLLSGRHADARFGPGEPSFEEAIEAESASARLQEGIPG